MKSTLRSAAARAFATATMATALTCGAVAQTWHASDGGAALEIGRGGVKQIAGAAGFISVGSTNSTISGNTDVYIVQTNLAGGIVWQIAYDFGGVDEGYDIVELVGGGFAITGSTTVGGAGGATNAFILVINAGGGAVWLKTFGGVNNELGADIIQAANGDLVVAGYSSNAAGLTDGLLIRQPVGACIAAPIFVNTYAPPGGGLNDYFRSVWEATVGGPGVAVGDLIVGGGTNSFAATTDAWLMRTTAVGVPIWSNRTGGAGAAVENFNSVIELTVGAQAGNIVGVGGTTGIAPSRLYVAKFVGPTGVQIGPDVAGGPVGSFTEMFCVRENLVNTPGNIILAGHTNPGLLGGDDAYAVEMAPAWNCPIGKAWSQEYGGAGNEQFLSVSEANGPCLPGYIFCGYTTSPALLPPPPDPQNMYLVRTNILGITGCFEIAPPDGCATPGYPTVGIGTPATAQPWGGCLPLFPRPIVGNLVFCLTVCPENRRDDADNDGIAGVTDDASALTGANAFPNPVIAGNSFTVRYTTDWTTTAPVSVLVSDMSGKVMLDRTVDDAAGTLSISTAGWPAGTYLVRLGSGTASQTKRIVVMDK
jgi:hypothetical protein